MTDAIGKVVWKSQYSPFGEARILVEEIQQPLRFLGQYRDDETELPYNVFRYYDPRLGRYITADPIRFGGGNTHFYTYANNDPVNQRDPDGLIAPLLAIGIVAGVAVGTTVATFGLSKIPGVKRALGSVGKKLSSAADAAIGRTKQAYYKVFPADLAIKRSEKQLARQARKAAIAKNKALALDAANGADSHTR